MKLLLNATKICFACSFLSLYISQLITKRNYKANTTVYANP